MPLSDGRLAELAEAAGLIEPSIVVRSLDGGPSAELEPERALAPASMIKVPIAFALEAARARAELDLRDPVTVTAANITSNDHPSPFVSGYRATVGELAHAMLAASDNVATNVLIDLLGRAAIDRDLATLGLRATRVRRKLSGSLPLIADPEATGRNAHPAAEAARLFLRLADLATRPPFIYAALAAQIWNDKLPRGLAVGDRFVHKTGDTDEVSHDGGLLRFAGGKTYVVVVYTALPSSPEADARHATFARSLRALLA